MRFIPTTALATLAIGSSALATLDAQSRGHLSTASPAVPTAIIDYSELLDSSCSQATNHPLDAELVAHVKAMLPSYRAQWATRGPVLLRAETEIAGQPFTYHEEFPAIITCGIPSMSFPLVLNAHLIRAGRDAAGTEAGEMTNFVNVLWHEMSHRFVHDIRDRYPDRMTPLLAKYSAEPPAVLSHLHLYAIEQLVYRKLGLQQDLDLVRTVQKKARNATVTARALEIVAKETPEAFVRELRTAPAQR